MHIDFGTMILLLDRGSKLKEPRGSALLSIPQYFSDWVPEILNFPFRDARFSFASETTVEIGLGNMPVPRGAPVTEFLPLTTAGAGGGVTRRFSRVSESSYRRTKLPFPGDLETGGWNLKWDPMLQEASQARRYVLLTYGGTTSSGNMWLS